MIPVSRQTLKRMPHYLSYLKSLPIDRPINISATGIAAELGLNQVQVRKDLAAVSSGGKPKVGYAISSLIGDIEKYLGCGDTNSAVIVGAGSLGMALMSYEGFADYGLDIVAAFDTNPALAGKEAHGKTIFSMSKLPDLCERLGVHIGIIAVPTQAAQGVCDVLVESGIRAVWNFAPVYLNVPNHVILQHENMAVSLSVLSKHLRIQADL